MTDTTNNTSLPECLGDKGQRYEIRAVSARTGRELTLGYCQAASGGSLARMAARNAQYRMVWVVDREQPMPTGKEGREEHGEDDGHEDSVAD